MSFTFRIRFFLNEDARIGCEEPELKIEPESNSTPIFVLRSYDGDTPIEDTSHLVLLGPNYSSKEEAVRKGKFTKKVLTLLGAKNQLGLDVGRDVAPGTITEVGKEFFKNKTGLGENVRIRNDKLGLNIYSTDQETKFFRSQARATLKKDSDNFRSDFADLWEDASEIDERVKLAAELYNLARRAVSDHTRLIATVSAVDTLSSGKKRPAEIKDYIDDLITQVEELRGILQGDDSWDKKEINREIQDLKSYIGGFKEYSFNQRAKSIIVEKIGDKEYCGQNPMDFVADCYRIRNDIIHSGPSSVDEEVDMKHKANCMDQLARDLILQSIHS